jgi:Flp pilus assembly protein TadB
MSINRIRLALSLSGMAVAVVAIMLNDGRVVWGAIALLAASLLLRVVARRRRPGEGREEP